MKGHSNIRQTNQTFGIAYFGTFPFWQTQSANARKNVKEPKFPLHTTHLKNKLKDEYKPP